MGDASLNSATSRATSSRTSYVRDNIAADSSLLENIINLWQRNPASESLSLERLNVCSHLQYRDERRSYFELSTIHSKPWSTSTAIAPFVYCMVFDHESFEEESTVRQCWFYPSWKHEVEIWRKHSMEGGKGKRIINKLIGLDLFSLSSFYHDKVRFTSASIIFFSGEWTYQQNIIKSDYGSGVVIMKSSLSLR